MKSSKNLAFEEFSKIVNYNISPRDMRRLQGEWALSHKSSIVQRGHEQSAAYSLQVTNSSYVTVGEKTKLALCHDIEYGRELGIEFAKKRQF